MPQVHSCPSCSEPPQAKGVCGSRWVGPGTCTFEMLLLPAPLSGPLLRRHSWAALPPRVIAALPQTHAQEMKYSSRTYWLLQQLLGKANETGSRKEMSVRHGGAGWRWAMVRMRWGGASQLHPLPLSSSFWEQVAPSGVPNLPYPWPLNPLPPHCPRAPHLISWEMGAHSSAVLHIPSIHPSNQQPPSATGCWASRGVQGSQVPARMEDTGVEGHFRWQREGKGNEHLFQFGWARKAC